MAQVQITFQDVNLNNELIKLISFTGQLDETNVDSEAQKIYQVIDEMQEPNMILDFAGLEYMNSKSIGYVTDWYSKTMSKNGKIVISRPRVNILDILKVVGITQIITVYENLEEAKASFTEGTPAPAVPQQPAMAAAAAPTNEQPTSPEAPQNPVA